jgi:hypothetical protein
MFRLQASQRFLKSQHFLLNETQVIEAFPIKCGRHLLSHSKDRFAPIYIVYLKSPIGGFLMSQHANEALHRFKVTGHSISFVAGGLFPAPYFDLTK